MIITKEMLVESFVKNILADLYDEYVSDVSAQEEAQTFDEYVWDNLRDLGEEAYKEIGAYYGDLDNAVSAVGLQDG